MLNDKKAPDVDQRVAEEREKWAPRLEAEVAAAFALARRPPPNGALTVAAAAVEAGTEAAVAAETLWGAA